MVAVDRGGVAVDVVAVGVDPDALFEVGSITKVMTATLVLQHVAQGDLGLDDPVAAHVPDLCFEPPTGTSSVTIRHLLTHASGIDCGEDFTDTGHGDDCLERYVAEAVDGSRLLHRPGERWSYSNGGFSLLGRLVEILDGRCWDDAVISRIFDAVGMRATTTARLAPRQRTVVGHRYDPARGAIVEEPGRMPRSAGPAGNVVATAADLIQFTRALFDGGGVLLPARLVDEMVRPHIGVRDANQGIGWLLPLPGLVVHGGATRGCTAMLGATPGLGAISVVADGPGAPAVAAEVRAHLFGQRPPPPPPPRDEPAIDQLDQSSCTGRYERRHVVQEVSWQNEQLIARTTFLGPVAELFPQPDPVALTPLGGRRFSSQRPYEDHLTLWDFTNPNKDGTPSFLLTNRLHRRTA